MSYSKVTSPPRRPINNCLLVNSGSYDTDSFTAFLFLFIIIFYFIYLFIFIYFILFLFMA